MPPVLGPVSPSPTRLWSCAEAKGRARWPSQMAKNDASSPSRKASITTSAPAAPNAPSNIIVDRRFGLGQRHGDDDALAGRQPVGLDDDRRALFAHIGQRRLRLREAGVGPRGNGVVAAQILGEALRAFELRGGLRRPERPDSGGVEIVDEAGHQRRLRPDDDEADGHQPAEGDDRRMVGDVESRDFGDPRHARVARRDEKLRQQGAARQRKGERVFAPARADEKNIHGAEPRPKENRPLSRRERASDQPRRRPSRGPRLIGPGR
jgi:hypothetical protein